MNAPVSKESLSRADDGVFELIPLTAIQPSETHIQQLRRKRYNMESLADLRVSILKLGVQQPVVVRKLAQPKGLVSYELVAGERRFRATGQAAIAHIPAVIRQLTDEEVLEVQLVENLQREDLHPLEEAAGYEELMRVAKLKKEELGDRVGKSRSWVFGRMNLLKLPAAAQSALQSGSIDVSRALLVASIGDPKRQAEVLAKALERNNENNPTYSVRQLRAEVMKERAVFPLVGAPFPTDDAGLVAAAGACGPCPYRTGNCDAEAADPDVCTNVPCYERKVKAHGDRRRAEVLAKGGKVLKGEEARAISPSIKTVYGHVDLDLVCGHDDFPEEAPKVPEGIDEYSREADQLPAMIAWREREEAWQPRTYRALLEGEQYDSVLIDDPKTKQLRELVPFKQAQQLLKKKGIDLPSYANRKRQEFKRAAPPAGKKEDPAAAKAQREAEERRREQEAAIALAVTERVVEQLKAKAGGDLGDEELVYLATGEFDNSMSSDLAPILLKAYGLKDSGRQFAQAMEKLTSKNLKSLVVVGLASMSLTEKYNGLGKVGEKIFARLKVDPKAIEKKVRAEFAAKDKKAK